MNLYGTFNTVNINLITNLINYYCTFNKQNERIHGKNVSMNTISINVPGNNKYC